MKDISNDDSFFLKSIPTGGKQLNSPMHKDSGNTNEQLLSKSSSLNKNPVRSYKSETTSFK